MVMAEISGVVDQKLCTQADASHPIPAKYRSVNRVSSAGAVEISTDLRWLSVKQNKPAN
jgi:hypothetical protein